MPGTEKNQNAVKPEDEKSTSFLYIRATPEEKGNWVRAAKRARQNLSEWVKSILNRESK